MQAPERLTRLGGRSEQLGRDQHRAVLPQQPRHRLHIVALGGRAVVHLWGRVRGTAYVQYWPAGASCPAPLVRTQEAATRIKYVQLGGAGTYVSTQWFTHLPFGTMWMSNVSRIQTW